MWWSIKSVCRTGTEMVFMYTSTAPFIHPSRCTFSLRGGAAGWMAWLSGARCRSAGWKHSGDKDIQRWFPRPFIFRFNLAAGKYQLFWETHVGKVHVLKLAGWQSFHFRHFSSDFRVGLAGSFSPFVGCFWHLLPHRGGGCFLQLSFLGRFLRLKNKTKKKKKKERFAEKTYFSQCCNFESLLGVWLTFGLGFLLGVAMGTSCGISSSSSCVSGFCSPSAVSSLTSSLAFVA